MPTRNTTVPAANRNPKNRTSKRIQMVFLPLRRNEMMRRLPQDQQICPRQTQRHTLDTLAMAEFSDDSEHLTAVL
jgi:hypothetical protein